MPIPKTFYFVFAIIFLLLPGQRNGCQELEIVSTIPLHIPVAGSLPFTGAALNMAVEHVRTKFTSTLNISLILLYNERDKYCEDSDGSAIIRLAEHYYRNMNRCLVIVTSACGGSFGVRYLARVPNNTPTNQTTSVGMAGSLTDIVAAFLKLFQFFHWSHVTVLIDTGAATNFYQAAAQIIKQLVLTPTFASLQFDEFPFNANDVQSCESSLRMAGGRSRVFLVLAHTFVVIRLLRLARDQRIIDNFEDYVFIIIQITPQSVYGSPSLLDQPMLEDEKIFRSVLYLTTYGNVNATDTTAGELNRALARRQETDYNTTLEPGLQPLYLHTIRETYSSVELAAQLANESYSSATNTSGAVCGGQRLIRESLLNRTFSFPSGQAEFDQYGRRSPELALFTYKQKPRSMMVSAHYVSRTWRLLLDNDSIEWQLGRPPPDMPICGFSKHQGLCFVTDRTTIDLQIALISLTIIGLFMVLGGTVYRKNKADAKRDQWWWRVLESDMDRKQGNAWNYSL